MYADLESKLECVPCSSVVQSKSTSTRTNTQLSTHKTQLLFRSDNRSAKTESSTVETREFRVYLPTKNKPCVLGVQGCSHHGLPSVLLLPRPPCFFFSPFLTSSSLLLLLLQLHLLLHLLVGLRNFRHLVVVVVDESTRRCSCCSGRSLAVRSSLWPLLLSSSMSL